MRTIYHGALAEVVRIRPEGEKRGILTLKWNHGFMDTSAAEYDSYEYETEPLYFLEQLMTDRQKYVLIRKFEKWYGDTSQETTVWALEFQIIVRMILSGYLIVNPKYLEMEEVTDEILEILIGK